MTRILRNLLQRFQIPRVCQLVDRHHRERGLPDQVADQRRPNETCSSRDKDRKVGHVLSLITSPKSVLLPRQHIHRERGQPVLAHIVAAGDMREGGLSVPGR